jgi:SAM-dependent methyltransferase
MALLTSHGPDRMIVATPSGRAGNDHNPTHHKGVAVARVSVLGPSPVLAHKSVLEPMNETSDHDLRRGWDAHYSRAAVLPDEPDPDTQATVACLRDLASDGPALELAVGHGRVAIPLAASGVEVDGIDFSAKAIELIRTHPKGGAIGASVADISDFALGREYSLVYLLFNSIENLTSQDKQVACFENAAAHLRPGGRFVVENVVPDLRRLPPGNTAVPFAVSDDYIGINEYTDATHQQFRSRHLYRRSDRSFAEFWVPFRFVWPSELDLMARIAGMTLEHRWSGWDRAPFTAESTSAVSVWRR